MRGYGRPVRPPPGILLQQHLEEIAALRAHGFLLRPADGVVPVRNKIQIYTCFNFPTLFAREIVLPDVADELGHVPGVERGGPDAQLVQDAPD